MKLTITNIITPGEETLIKEMTKEIVDITIKNKIGNIKIKNIKIEVEENKKWGKKIYIIF